MVKQALARDTDSDPISSHPIDRLEEKITLLVAMVARLRAEQARSTDETARLTEELDALRVRVADAEGSMAEVAALREERDLIRGRVSEMLQQIEHVTI